MSDFITVLALTQGNDQITQHAIAGDPLTPGLAITPAIQGDGVYTGGWTVTHTPSGWAVVRTNYCLTCLRRAAQWLAQANVDWTRDRETVMADPDAKQAAEDFGTFVDECEGAECGVFIDELVA